MTRDEILKLEAGREMDALVADLMGWTNTRRRHRGTLIMTPPADDPVRRGGQVPPHYSTDIAAAWEVVAQMQSLGYPPSIIRVKDEGWHWEVRFRGIGTRPAYAEDVCLAICRAALLAVMEVQS